MIIHFLFVALLCYQTVNGSDEKTSKILSCIQPSQPRSTTPMGSRTWFVSGNSTTEQDIICSHIATSDGVRMCACMCKANLKAILKSFDAKWMIPKYQTCNNLEETKDLKLNCYDLITTDKSRVCSCMCSFLEDKPVGEKYNELSSQELPLNIDVGKSIKWSENTTNPSNDKMSKEIQEPSSIPTSDEQKARSLLASSGNQDSKIYVTPMSSVEELYTIYVTTEGQPKSVIDEMNEKEKESKDEGQTSNEKSAAEDNIVIVYPNTYFTTAKPKPAISRSPTISRVARSDENVFYVYPQKITKPEKQAKTLRMSNTVEDGNKRALPSSTTESSKLVEMIYAQKISESSTTMAPLDTANASDVISLDVEVASGSPVIISAYGSKDIRLEPELPTEVKVEEHPMKLIMLKDFDNDLVAPADNSAEKMVIADAADDYLEDDSVTIAYSGKVYRRVPTESSSEATQLTASTTETNIVSATEKLASSTIETVTVDTNNRITSSTPLLLSLSAGYFAGSVTESTTQSLPLSSSAPTSTIAASSTQATTELVEQHSSTTSLQSASISSVLTSSAIPISEKSATTESISSTTEKTEKVDPADDLKLKRQHQFMEFLKKRSKETSKHRLSASSLKRSSTTHAPSVNVRKILLDASQRRAALLKNKDKRKTVSDEDTNSTESSNDKEEIKDSSNEVNKEDNTSTKDSTSTTAMPKVSHSLRAGILQRRPLYVRTSTTPAEQL